MLIKRILWASDGSKESLAALRWAEVFATRYAAKITGLSVIENPNLRTLEVPADLKKEISRIDSEMGKREALRLERIHNDLRKKGIKAETHIVRGVPYQEIIQAAERQACELIAMGKAGLGLFGRMLLGSTTAKVLRESRVPVLTVREPVKKHAVKKILVPIGFSPADTMSLEWALESAKMFDAAVILLHIIEVHKSYDAVKGGFMGRMRESATKKLRAMLATIPGAKGVKLEAKVKAFPRAWAGIVSFVRDEGISMIVMGTHARRGASRFFLGSVAETVIKEAPCPVITIRP